MRRWLIDVVETLALTLVLFVGIQTFIAQPFQVHQDSMENTLLPGQYVLVDKLTPRFEPYARGDIIVFTPPGAGANATPYIKRVIGLPVDTITIADGQVSVNGHALSEPYTYGGQPTLPDGARDRWVVPAGSLFVLGDHRMVSDDSRVFGTVPIASVIGRAWLRYWPIGAMEVLAAPSYPDLSPSGPSASP